jgi:hypothetical protein
MGEERDASVPVPVERAGESSKRPGLKRHPDFGAGAAQRSAAPCRPATIARWIDHPRPPTTVLPRSQNSSAGRGGGLGALGSSCPWSFSLLCHDLLDLAVADMRAFVHWAFRISTVRTAAAWQRGGRVWPQESLWSSSCSPCPALKAARFSSSVLFWFALPCGDHIPACRSFDLPFHHEGSVVALSCNGLASLTTSCSSHLLEVPSGEDAGGVGTDSRPEFLLNRLADNSLRIALPITTCCGRKAHHVPHYRDANTWMSECKWRVASAGKLSMR